MNGREDRLSRTHRLGIAGVLQLDFTLQEEVLYAVPGQKTPRSRATDDRYNNIMYIYIKNGKWEDRRDWDQLGGKLA